MRGNQSYFQHFTFGLDKVIDKIFLKKRREVFECFMKQFKPDYNDTILDIGVSDEEHISSNLFEKLYPYTHQITAVGIGCLKHLEDVYPGLKFIQGDGRKLPFADKSFDYVYSHAVIEHTGSRKLQFAFLSEAFRVARKGIFVTTPNRLHPLEFHTATPLIHYLPHKYYRKIYGLIGKQFYANEENLNLLTPKELLNMGRNLNSNVDINLYSTKFLLFPANLMLIVAKK